MPTRFTDTQGREWQVSITVATVKRVKQDTGFDLLAVVGGESAVTRLSTDPVLLVDVLYSILKPEADSRKIDAEGFAAAIAGDALDTCTAAFLEELANFFPAPRRVVFKKALARIREAEAEILKQAETTLDDKEVVRRLVSKSGGQSIAAPPSSE